MAGEDNLRESKENSYVMGWGERGWGVSLGCIFIYHCDYLKFLVTILQYDKTA